MPTDDAAPVTPAMSAPHLPPRRRSNKGLMIAAVVAICLAAFVVVTGVLSRAHQNNEVKGWTTAVAIPAVNVVAPTAETGNQALVLPGTLAAYYNAPIYSRVSGYVHVWFVDIGAKVKAGQLLATIDTPELDQQLVQARADLERAKANMSLAGTTAQRWSKLLAQDAVSKQESEEKAGDLAVKTADVNASNANVQRLLALKSFARIVAPFEGVVTARKTDIGALVNAGAGASSGSELFDVAKVDQLRLYVNVPQSDSGHIKPGVTAELTVPEYPGRSFPAKLAATANAVSGASGTLLVELMVDNADRTLQSGDYAQVRFDLPNTGGSGAGTLVLPSSAMLFLKSGEAVAVVGSDNHVRLQHVSVGRDLGATIEVTAGLKPSDRVINNPPDSITDGELVRVMTPGQAGSGHEAG